MDKSNDYECTIIAEFDEHNLVVLDAAGQMGGQMQMRVAKDDGRFIIGRFYAVTFTDAE